MDYRLLGKGISFNGQHYPLSVQATLDKLGIARNWNTTVVMRSSTQISRPDVRPGAHPGEWVIAWDNFSKGICDAESNHIGGIYLAEGANGLVPGALRPDPPVFVGSSTTAEENPPAWIGAFNNIVFVLSGRRARSFTTTTGIASSLTLTADVDFGTGVLVTDAIVWNNELVVGFGGSTNKIQTRNTGGTWTTATDAVYADHWAQVQDRLWRATATNQVGNIASAANPITLSGYSAGITVGDAQYGITDLNAIGQQLIVSKCEGLFSGDAGAVFPNILPQFLVSPDADNGRQTLIRGSDAFYPHRSGIQRYVNGATEAVGPEQTVHLQELADRLPGMRCRSMCGYGDYVYAAFEDSGFPRVAPTRVLTTTNDTAFTNVTTNLTDSDLTTSVELTGASSAYRVYVGYSTSAFYGLLFEIAQGAGNTVAATWEYWNGSAWTAFPVAAALQDRTITQSLSAPQPVDTTGNLNKSGFVWWENAGISDWASSTVDGVAAFWIRFYTSSGAFPSVFVGEVRVVTNNPRSYVMRGRARNRPGDPAGPSILWEPSATVTGMPVPTAMAMLQLDTFPYTRGPALIVAGQSTVAVTSGSLNAVDVVPFVGSGSQQVALPKHDGGAPFKQKQFLAFVTKGRTISSDRDFALNRRLDNATAWDSVNSSVTTTPSYLGMSAVVGYSIQPQIVFNAFTTNPIPEVNAIECIYRDHVTIGSGNVRSEIHTLVIDLTAEGGNGTPTADVALDNLRTQLRNTAGTYIDPLGTNRTATLMDFELLETRSRAGGYPDLTVQIKIEETA